ncbi:Protein ENHANCED DISEASE RESISTANCE 4, partial [Mucuna pruriens]
MKRIRCEYLDSSVWSKMSGESVPKPRLVLCPKCWQLLPESPNYDVYKCGGCGTTLQAKKRRSKAVNSESSTHETDAAPRNAVDPKADDKQYSNGETLVSCEENGLRKKLTTSSSGECSLDGNDGKDQIENGECNGEQLVTSLENGFREKETSSSSGECSLNGNGGRDQIVDGECNGEQPVISQENGLRENATSSSIGECSLNGNGGRDQIENGECIGQKPVISQENGLRAKATSSSSGECSFDGNDGRDQIENGECNGEQIGQFNLPDEELENEKDIHKLSDMRRHTMSNNGCSDELTHFEIEASAELMAESSVENAKNTKLQLEGEELSNGNVSLGGAGEQLVSALDKEDANYEKSAPVQVKSEVDIAGNDLEVVEELNNGNLLLEGAEQELFSGSDREEVNNDKSALVGATAKPKVVINGSNKAGSEELNDGNLLLVVTEEEVNVCASDGEDPKHNQSGLVGAKSEVDNTGNTSTAKSLSTEEGSISCAYPCELEKGTSGNHAASKTIHHSFDRVSSVDTFDNTEVINPSFETSGTLGGYSKLSTTRSYHAYDGSISSNDGVDEQFPNQYLDSFENTSIVASGVSEGGSRKGKGLVNNALRGDLETQQQSYFPGGKPRVPRDSRRNQNEVPDTTRHSHAHWMRTKKDEFPPKMAHRRSGSQSGYESGSTSNQMHDEFHCSSSYLSLDSFDDPDQEKMKLLRMVYKLQDQLNRTSYVSGETNGRLSVGNHISAYQSHDLHERRFYHGLDYPRCDGVCGHGINWCQKHNFSHCPQQWQCSAELPPRVLYQHEELCRPNPGHSCCSPHHSYPSSPRQFVTSNLLAHGHETNSCDQRHRPEVKKYFREKPSLTRRHYRPVAGGAPFVTCHKCLKLLHLPADFLLFKRVCHQLKCGACQEVLKFSLQNGSHIVSYAPNALELDDLNEVIDGSNLHSESHANYYHSPHADHFSYSVSYSEGDPVSVTSLHSLHGNAYDKPNVSSGTLESITEKENTASRGSSTSTSKAAPVETDELAVNSPNMSSEMEAHSQPKSSPLHQLMGYTSPSQVIRGIP